MKLSIEEFMSRLAASERRGFALETAAEDPRLEELERENARLRNFVADLLLARSA